MRMSPDKKAICPYSASAEILEKNNPILFAGQRVYDTTNKKSKIGDGTTDWINLAWESVGGGGNTVVENNLNSESTVNALSAKMGKELKEDVDALTKSSEFFENNIEDLSTNMEELSTNVDSLSTNVGALSKIVEEVSEKQADSITDEELAEILI